jgi:vitamin B12 transporter
MLTSACMRWLALLVVLAPRLAAAQELGVSAEVERPIARTAGDDPTASATEIDARSRPTALDTLESALLEAPGVRPLASGGYGSATTLSLRGADPDQLEVVFGDVPITTADGSAFDLSTVPLWALERVEVYRSGAPAWLGVSPIGGVVRLIPRSSGPRFEATAGAGSFGLAHARASTAFGRRDLRFVSALGFTSSEGDFRYLDDGRTALDPTDDVERTRENGWLREGSGLVHLTARAGDGRLGIFLFGLSRQAGVIGPAPSPARFARRSEISLLGGLSYELTERGRPADRADWRVAITTSLAVRRRRFTDLYGESGLGARESDDVSFRSVLRVASSGRAADWLELTGVALYVREDLLPEDALARQPVADSARDSGALSLEGRFHGSVDGVRLELRPSARLSVVGSRLFELRAERSGEATESTSFAPTFRLGAAVAPIPELTIAASFSSATRLPSMVELFGDRGYLRGDTTLRPERAETIDAGLVLRGRHDVLSGSAELRGFVSFASDLIRYRRTSQYTAVPENVASAVLFGAELGAHAAITRHVSVAGAVSLLDTRTEYLGGERRLPLRPWMTAYVRPSASAFGVGALDRLEGWVEVAHVAEAFATPANEPGAVIAGRTRVGLGVSAYVWDSRMRLDLSVRDLFDARGTDLLGFPLPGRSFGAALSVASD